MQGRDGRAICGRCSTPQRRLQLLREGWRGAMTPFLLAIALDCVYQLMTVRFIYPLELLFTATLLALVPYALLRGQLQSPRAPFPARTRPRPVKRADPTMINSSPEETHQGRPTHVERIQDAGLVQACGDGDPQGRIFRGQDRAGALRPNLSQVSGLLRLLVVAKIIPGREEVFYKYAKVSRKQSPRSRTPWPSCSCITCAGCSSPSRGKPTSCIRAFSISTPDKYTEDAVKIFSATGLRTVFENLEGFPMDWETNPAAFIKFARDHQCPSFLEYAEYPYVSATEIGRP